MCSAWYAGSRLLGLLICLGGSLVFGRAPVWFALSLERGGSLVIHIPRALTLGDLRRPLKYSDSESELWARLWRGRGSRASGTRPCCLGRISGWLGAGSWPGSSCAWRARSIPSSRVLTLLIKDSSWAVFCVAMILLSRIRRHSSLKFALCLWASCNSALSASFLILAKFNCSVTSFICLSGSAAAAWCSCADAASWNPWIAAVAALVKGELASPCPSRDSVLTSALGSYWSLGEPARESVVSFS